MRAIPQDAGTAMRVRYHVFCPNQSPTARKARAITQSWPSYPALRSERAYTLFQELRPELMARLRAASFPDQALVAFDRFLSKLPAGVQLFSLFRANPQMIDLLMDILGTAPSLSEYLSQNVQVLDAVIGGSFWHDWPGEAELRDQLIRRLAAETDYERQLDLSRRWSKEWHFRIGVHVLRGLIDAEQAGREYADLARATLGGIWPSVCAEFARKHGAMHAFTCNKYRTCCGYTCKFIYFKFTCHYAKSPIKANMAYGLSFKEPLPDLVCTGMADEVIVAPSFFKLVI